MAGIYSIGGSAGHRYAGWLETVEAKNFQFGGKVFNGSPKAIYVGSNRVWIPGWLESATMQAIIGAFGQRDGKAVINATNAYLNQLAASDRDKATALAWFINDIVPQDARTIYSFVPTLNVVRWLEFDGNSYISTDVDVEHSDFKVTTLFRAYRAQSNWDVIYGNGWGGPSRYLDAMVRSGGTIWLTTGNKEYTSGVPYSYNTDAVLEQSFTTIKLTSGSNVYEYATGSTQTPLNKSGQPFRIGYHQSFGHLIGRVSYLQYEVDGELVNWFIPATVNNVIGMIDAVSGTFYANAGSGSFTISESPAP